MATAALLPLALTVDEVPVLRSAMHDIQISTAGYYAVTAQSASVETLSTCVRSTTSFIQVLNDLLANESTTADDYKALFDLPPDGHAEILLAFKYVRNVMQHVLHPVEPQQNALIGGLHGLRGYFLWADMPPGVHAKLRPATQSLRPYFEQHLHGHEVTDTFLEALHAFGTIVPDVVHRDVSGEWTGFPLAQQPGVETALHPEYLR